MASKLNFRIDFSLGDLSDVVADLGLLDGKALVALRRDTVNAIEANVYEEAIEDMTRTINLTPQYVAGKIKRSPAANDRTTATIRSDGRGTILGRFNPRQLDKPVNWSNQRIRDEVKAKFGPYPGWTMRTGDASRGIAPDRKQAGVAVTIKRGTPQLFAGGFTMRLRNGAQPGDNIGVFTRAKGGKPVQRYGPTVYQLFRNYINVYEDRISDRLQAEFLVRLDRAVAGAIR